MRSFRSGSFPERFCDKRGECVFRRFDSARKEEACADALGERFDRIGRNVKESAGAVRVDNRRLAVRIGEREKSVPVLECRIRRHHRGTGGAVDVRVGVIEFRNGEPFSEQPGRKRPAGNAGTRADGIALIWKDGKLPAVFRKARMIPVGVIVHKVIMLTVGGKIEVVQEVLIGEQGSAAEFPEGTFHFVEPFDRKIREKLIECFIGIALFPLFELLPVQFCGARRRAPAMRRIRFVDERKRDQGGIIFQRESGIRIDVTEKTFRPAFPVRINTVVDIEEGFVFPHILNCAQIAEFGGGNVAARNINVG